MKRIFLFMGLLLAFSSITTAQKKVTVSEKSSGINDVFVHVKFANKITLENWNKKEILIEASVNINNNKQNEYFSLKADKIGDSFVVKSDYGEFFKKYKNYYTYYDDEKDEKNERIEKNYNCSNKIIVNYKVFVPRNMELKVKSISGDVKIDSYSGKLNLDLISGNIDVKKHSENMRLKTISGDIDVYISDAYFEVKTLTGGIYSDLEIDFSKSKHYNSSRKISAKVKEGRATLNMSTISGDIFLRKT